ncbi:MAG: guanylate kinase, partial [Desulfovibrio sp.]
SGCGKTTLVRRLTREFPDFSYSVSYTTRGPRGPERDGIDYHFVDQEKFQQLISQDFFAEWAEVHGNFYGTPLHEIEELLGQGRDVLLDVDVQGARQLKEKLPGLYVFILPPSRKALEERLLRRGTDSPEVIHRRMGNAADEIAQAVLFDAWVVNDDLDEAYDELRAAFLAQRLKPSKNPDFLQELLCNWDQDQ